MRLRVVHHTDKETLVKHVHTFTLADAVVFTDEWKSYHGYIAMFEFGINLKRITPSFISALVALH
jgi:hypothetical protein